MYRYYDRIPGSSRSRSDAGTSETNPFEARLTGAVEDATAPLRAICDRFGLLSGWDLAIRERQQSRAG
jgi:hypothetical protein